MERNVISNLSSLTLVDDPLLQKMVMLSEDCICDYLLEGIQKEEDVIEVDIGIGILYLNIVDEELNYKFVPSKRFENKLKKTAYLEASPLVAKLEKSLDKKFTNAYKELL